MWVGRRADETFWSRVIRDTYERATLESTHAAPLFKNFYSIVQYSTVLYMIQQVADSTDGVSSLSRPCTNYYGIKRIFSERSFFEFIYLESLEVLTVLQAEGAEKSRRSYFSDKETNNKK